MRPRWFWSGLTLVCAGNVVAAAAATRIYGLGGAVGAVAFGGVTGYAYGHAAGRRA